MLDGKYRLLEEIGRGGMGTVFRARDEVLERDVAVKLLLPEIQARSEAVELFRREARAMASINHKNVVRVYASGRYGSADYLVTELIDGYSLEHLIDATHLRQTLIDVSDLIDILIEASTGLAAIHEAGVVHRDIKPGNVMVEEDTDRVLIMDFGIGHKVDAFSEKSAVAPRGTPAYMAPEIIQSRYISPSEERLADIYAFGAMAFELCTNEPPFDGGSFMEVLEKHLEEAPPRLTRWRKDLPAELVDVVAICLEKDLSRRFQSASKITETLERLRRGHERSGRLQRTARRRARLLKSSF